MRIPRPTTGRHLLATGVLILAASGLLRAAPAAESAPILNLKEIEPRTVSVASNRLFLTITGTPPRVLTPTNTSPVPLKRRDPPTALKRVQVTDGKQLIGRAVAWAPRPTAKTPVVTLQLTFETPNQAAAAAQTFRHRETAPAPPTQQKQNTSAAQQKQGTAAPTQKQKALKPSR